MKKSLKKFVMTALVAGAMALSLSACGDKKETETASGSAQSGTTNTKSTSGYSFTYNGTKISLNEDMTDVIAAIGEATDYFESESCAFQGMDKVYTYNSFVIKTYPEGDKDYVLSVSLKDDTVSTEEGISVGAAAVDVTKAYGEGEANSASAIYTKDKTTLTFIFENDKVTSIEYTAVQ